MQNHLIPIQITLQAANAADIRQLVQDLAGTLSEIRPADIPERTEVSTVDNLAPAPAAKESEIKTEIETVTIEDIPTVEQIRAKAQALGPGKKAEIKALLDEFGVKNLSAIPEDRRAEFMSRLEEL